MLLGILALSNNIVYQQYITYMSFLILEFHLENISNKTFP